MNTAEYRNKRFIIQKPSIKAVFAKNNGEYRKKGIARDSLFQSTIFKFGCLQNKTDSVKRLQQQSFILTHAHHAGKHVFFAVFIAHITFQLAKRNVIIDVDDKCVHNHRIHIANFEF